MCVARESSAIAVLKERDPPCKQRPHASLVIADGVVESYAGTEIARAPIRGKFRRGPAAEHVLRLRQVERAIPGSNSWVDRRSRVQVSVGAPAECIELRLRLEIFFLDLCRQGRGTLTRLFG